MKFTNFFVAICLMAGLAHSVQAAPVEPITFSTSISPNPVRPGEIASVRVNATVLPGWHVYSVIPSTQAGQGPSPTDISAAGDWVPAARSTEDDPIVQFDNNFGFVVRLHQVKALFTRAFRVPANETAAGTIPVTLHYQVCNDSVCHPPTDVSLIAKIAVGQGPVRTAYAMAPNVAPLPSVQSGVPAVQEVQHAPSGLFAFLAAAITAGLLAILTPCVFPLIPITLSGFVKQANGDRQKVTRLAVGFALGIVALYVALGGIVALLLGATGANRVASNPWVNLVEFVIFVVFALSFFEIITLQLPASLSGLQTTARAHGGTVGLVLLGMAFVLASFTCTAPFVGTLLVSAAGGQHIRPLLGMAAFALAFASPFFIFGFNPGWISKIPKSGEWLARAKAVLGFIELAAALKFLSSADQVWQWKILTAPVLLGAWALIAVLAGFYLLGVLRFGLADSAPSSGVSLARKAGAFAFFAAALYCFWGISGRPVHPWLAAFLPPAGYGGVDAATGLKWHPDLQSALDEGTTSGKLLLIDFTGYTCTNCRLNERAVFPLPEIQQRLAHFSLAQLYTDGGADGPRNQKYELDHFNDVALPLYGVVDPKSGRVIDSIAGVITPGKFAAFLDHALSGQSLPAASAPAAAWAAYSDAQIAAAHQQSKPVIIDFTADWCVNCKVIEKEVFADPSVVPQLTNFVTLQSDMTDWSSPKNAALQQKFNVVSLPAIVFLDKNGSEIKSLRITGRLPVADFLKRLTAARYN